MADDRVLETPDEQLARVTKEFEDLRSTVLARLATRPTGDIEPTVRSTAKAGTLILNGQTPLRSDYPALWQWVQDNGLILANLFTNGNGTTTFGIPNFAGRIPVGVGTLGSDVYALGNAGGAAFLTLAVANLPSHDHNVSGSSNGAGGHTHGFGTSSDGGHSGHTNAPSSVGVATGGASTTNFPSFYNNNFGTHSHTGGTDNQGSHSHTINVDVSPTGSGTAFDNRQAYIAINWMIYT